MNCPQCQERLDERLDDLRAPLLRGEMSGALAREQAALMLEETVRDCPDCAAELRSHVATRLALMATADVPLATVPPALRTNVRRALEREPVLPTRAPVFRWAWTGGALLSAALLFLVARPILDRAQAPVAPSTEDAAPALQQAPETAKSSPVGAIPAAKAPARKPPPPALKATPPSPKSAAPLPSFNNAAPASIAPLPTVEAPPAREAPPIAAEHRQRKALQDVAPIKQKSAVAPRVARQPVLSVPPMPSLSKSAGALAVPVSPFASAKHRAPRLDAPSEPHLESKLLAPTGAALGLRVALVKGAIDAEAARADTLAAPVAPAPAAPASADSAGDARLGSSPPAASVGGAGGSSFAANGTFRSTLPNLNQGAMDAAPPVAAAKPPVAADSAALAYRRSEPTNRDANGSSSSSLARSGTPHRAAKMAARRAIAPLQVTVSVEHAVPNARVVGKIVGKPVEPKVLWMGDLAARQAVPVSLAPLAPVAGDTVLLSVEQQVSLGSSRTLASAPVAVP